MKSGEEKRRKVGRVSRLHGMKRSLGKRLEGVSKSLARENA